MGWWIERQREIYQSKARVLGAEPPPDKLKTWKKEELTLTFIRMGSVLLWLFAAYFALAGFWHWWTWPYAATGLGLGIWAWRVPKGFGEPPRQAQDETEEPNE